MRILITGISGFVARHFVEYLSSLGEPVMVAGVHHHNLPGFLCDQYKHIDCRFYQANLLDQNRLREILAEVQPEYILHLASKSSVAYSWQHPAETIRHNTGIFISLIENVRQLGLTCRILSVGSAEEYGIVPESELPLRENRCPNPASPYGTSRMLQQKLVEIYAKNYNLDIIHTRSFNHIGPYQQAGFVVSSFAKQIAEGIRAGKESIDITVGDLQVTRDFTDVRDVVKAYHLLLKKGSTGQTYNICSNKAVLLKDLVDRFSQLTGKHIRYQTDPHIIRPTENKKLIGSYDKIREELGWAPAIPLDESLQSLLDFWLNAN
ncbi:MAG TPA: GDP-mannose 4,6-dehydratase [Ferruginibacter sp.]|nr:GDP-mannose 4,6-dehydratase [Ferruginibacter sp.]